MMSHSITGRGRLLGILPLLFVLFQGIHHWQRGDFDHILWICHVSNFLLGIGIFLSSSLVIGIASLCIIAGIPLWILDMAVSGDITVVTFCSHLGGLAVAIWAVRQVKWKEGIWTLALGYHLFVQLVSHFLTHPKYNVNISHDLYPGMDKIFDHYWQYWIFLTITAGLTLWGIELILRNFVASNGKD